MQATASPWQKLIRKALWLGLPFALAMGYPAAVMYGAGEFMLIREVVRRQTESKRPVLYGSAYSNPDHFLKIESTLARRPLALVLGTSRCMQFRSRFCRPEARMYNAGGGASRLQHFIPFLERIPLAAQPKVLVIGLDQNFFNPAWDLATQDDIALRLRQDINPFGILRSNWLSLFADTSKGKISLTKIFAQAGNEEFIGVKAHMIHAYFRNDGSVHSDRYFHNPLDDARSQDYQFQDTFQRIEKGIIRFEHGGAVSEEALKELDRLLAYCAQRRIHVIGFLPPYAHAVYERLVERKKDYGYLFALEGRLKPLFEARHFPFHNFSDLQTLGASDRETMDGFHGSEKAYLRLFLRIAEGDAVLQPFVDFEELRRRLESAAGYYTVFHNEF